MMRGIRKSLKGEKGERRASSTSNGSHSRMSSLNGSSSSFTASLVASSSASMSAHSSNKETPKKIIRATVDYTAQAPGEISFQAGDFYWVTGRENDTEYYEACNPLTNVKGLVPVASFEVLNQRKRPDSYTAKSNNSFIISNLHLSNSPNSMSPERFSNSSRRPSLNNVNSSSSLSTSSMNGVLYGVVMYDFEARPDSDELDVNKGEYLILCAHHEFEWFIAKPINRLGGPGLVPVAYVKTLNLATKKISGGDIVDEIKESGLPTVSEWKNKTAKYKAALINLTEEESRHQNQSNSNAHNQFVQQQKTLYEYDDQTSNTEAGSNLSQQQFKEQSYPGQSQSGSYSIFTSSPFDTDTCSLFQKNIYVTDIKIDGFYYNKMTPADERHGRYWYHIVAKLSNNKVRSVARYYDDLYEFHIQLKKAFPVEAGKGNNNSNDRILPFFPAPHPNVTASMAYTRYQQLDEYLASLIAMPEYISKSKPVLILLNLRGDVDKEFEEGEDIELPNVVGYNEDGVEKMKLEQQPSSGIGMNSLSTVTSGSSLNGATLTLSGANLSGPTDNSSAAAVAAAVHTQPPPSLNSNSARSSADTNKSQLSYQMGQLNLKTDSVSTNATSTSEAVASRNSSLQDSINGGSSLATATIMNPYDSSTPSKDLYAGMSPSQKPALKISTTSPTMPSNVQYISTPTPNSASVTSPPVIKNVKIKFYYEDDIFAISVPTNTTLLDLKMKISSRINYKLEKIRLFIKSKNVAEFSDDDLSKEIDRDEFLRQIMKKDPKLKLIIITDEASSDDNEDDQI